MGELAAREEAEGLLDPERYRSFAREVEESKRTLLELLIRLKARASRSSATAPPARATRCSTTAASAWTSYYTVDRNRTSTAAPPPVRTSHLFAGADRRDATGRDVVLPWTLARGSPRSLLHRGVGAQLIVPIPFATVLESQRVPRLTSVHGRRLDKLSDEGRDLLRRLRRPDGRGDANGSRSR